jgi:hypothetical protein
MSSKAPQVQILLCFLIALSIASSLFFANVGGVFRRIACEDISQIAVAMHLIPMLNQGHNDVPAQLIDFIVVSWIAVHLTCENHHWVLFVSAMSVAVAAAWSHAVLIPYRGSSVLLTDIEYRRTLTGHTPW